MTTDVALLRKRFAARRATLRRLVAENAIRMAVVRRCPALNQMTLAIIRRLSGESAIGPAAALRANDRHFRAPRQGSQRPTAGGAAEVLA